jgi:uncharacterized membrane protein
MATKATKIKALDLPLPGERILYTAAVVGILCLALALRLIGLDKGIWLDEYATLQIIFQESSAKTIQAVQADNHPPLYFILLRTWSQFGTGTSFLRLPSALFGVGTVAVVMVWIKRYSRLGSLLAGLLCATLPLLLFHSQEIRHYTLLTFLTALSLYFAARSADEPDKPSNYTGLSLSLTAAIATHLLGIFILGAAAVLIASTPGSLRKVNRLRLGSAFLLPLAAFSFFFLFFLQDLQNNITNWWVSPVSWDLLASTSRDVFGVDKILWPIPKIKSLLHWRSRWVNLFYVGAFPAFGLLLALFGNWRRSLPLLAAASFYWLELFAYSLFARPLVLSRTVLPGLVPLLGFVGLQAASIQSRSIRILAALFLIYLSLVFGLHWVKYDAQSPRELWLELSQALQAKSSFEDTVIFYPSYTEGPVRF